LEQHNIALPKNFKQEVLAQTVALVAIDGQLAGVIVCKDQVRTESKSTIKRLKDLGVQKLLMVTGDNKTTAQAIAKQLGVRQVVAEALPGDKIHAIEDIKERPVAFVGDGVNDAPVLTASDLGIALGARGSTAASESADVVIMTDDLGQVATAKLIAKRTLYIARQSILVGIALSIVLMFIFATGHFKPVYGAAIQELVDVVVIFNALRAHSEIKNK
jgi:P-type E1-E2 ATPase